MEKIMVELRVEGMTCGHCVDAITRAVKKADPGAHVLVDLASGRVTVDGDAPEAAVRRALDEAGYPASALADAGKPGRAGGGCCGCR
jgi:copper chaperone